MPILCKPSSSFFHFWRRFRGVLTHPSCSPTTRQCPTPMGSFFFSRIRGRVTRPLAAPPDTPRGYPPVDPPPIAQNRYFVQFFDGISSSISHFHAVRMIPARIMKDFRHAVPGLCRIRHNFVRVVVNNGYPIPRIR